MTDYDLALVENAMSNADALREHQRQSDASLLDRADRYIATVAGFADATQAERTGLVLVADLAFMLRIRTSSPSDA